MTHENDQARKPTTDIVVKRRALKLGLLASLFGLIGRATARAGDALSIDKDGATIAAKSINFGNRYGTLLTLWNPNFELGIQPDTLYARSAKSFSWYKGGTYVPSSGTSVNPGPGGATMMSLSDGTLTVSDRIVGNGDATVGKALTVNGTFTGNGNATLGNSLTVAGGSATQTTAGGNTLDVQSTARVQPHRKGLALYVTATSDDADKLVEFRHSNGTEGIGFGHNTIYATGSNTDQSLRLKARGNRNVEIARNGSNYAIACGVEPLRMIRGVIAADGTGRTGSGFQSIRRDGGVYDITFQPPFSGTPAASVTQIFSSENRASPFGTANGWPGSIHDNASIVYLSGDKMRVATGNNNGDREDRHFSFVVMGPA